MARAPLLVLAALLSGCLASGGGGDGGDEGAGPGIAVAMRDNAYDPLVLQVPVGARVTWTNHDAVAHTVTPSDPDLWGSPGSGDDSKDWLKEGESWSFTFREAGSFEYSCIPHAYQGKDGRWTGMVATVVVG